MNGSPSYRLCVYDSSANPQPMMAMALPTAVFWKEAGLPMPALGLTLPVTRDGSNECWQTTYTKATVNNGSVFSAKGP